jgi:hypothetical protein
MSYGIAISFAAAAIGISCIATDASARTGGGKSNSVVGVGGPPGVQSGGAAGGARYYAPASYNSNTVCGRYPYRPCNR